MNITDSKGNWVMSVLVTKADGHKCPRCWHIHTVNDNHDDLCDRCCHAIMNGWPGHESVPHIVAAMNAQRLKYSNNLTVVDTIQVPVAPKLVPEMTLNYHKLENQLSTAYEFDVTLAMNAHGVFSCVREVKKIIPDPKDKKGFDFIILDEPPENPREVRVFSAHGTPEGHEWLLRSLTDDQIYGERFKVKVHKPKKPKASEVVDSGSSS
jgi:hypothetical protein